MGKRDNLIKQDLEITAVTAGAAPVQLPVKIISIFPAFAHRNFQLYFAGQAISLIGFWLHQVAMGWLIFQLTGSALWIGTVAAIGGLPFLIFTTFAGVIIDKVNKQKLLIITQILEAVIAIFLGVLVLTSKANLPVILALVFIHGIVGALDLPARLAFVVEMVGKRDLASATPITNGLFNAARFIGPVLAGAIIVSLGLAWPFILNGLSFLAGIWAIAKIKPIYNYKPEEDIHPLQSLKNGLKYSFGHPQLLYFMILAAATAIFAWPYQILMPLVAENVFSSGASGLGSLLSAAGAGSLVGAIVTSARAHVKNKGSLVLLGLIISGVSLLLFSFNNSFVLAHILLFAVGFGLLTQASTLNTLVQLISPDQMRGRIMAVYLTMFIGMIPIGSALAGSLAQRTSPLFTIGTGASVLLIIGIFLYFKGVFSNLSS